MAQRLKLLQPRYTVITVAGTNGKGSHVAMLDTAYRLAGYRVGTYTSPHLVHYNERIRLAGEPVADDVICRAFTQVEAARGEIPLTFFEFGTLAALVIFAEAAPDIAILEVGMGGRLDAVNMLDADVAVIATLDIDHVEWLGGTREIIAREKAGILRSGRPAVCSDPEAPASLLAYADEQAVPLALLGVDYHFSEQGERWSWWSGAVSLPDLPRPALSGSYQLRNAAGVLKVIDLLQSRHPVTGEQLADALARVRLQGRFQRFSGPVELILDVAHNAQAVSAFAANLAALPTVSRTHVVLGILRTKDRVGVMRTLDSLVDRWHLATVDAARGASAAELHATWQSLPRRRPATCYESIVQAWRAACTEAAVGERILVIGSFLTVGEVLRDLAAREDPTALSAGTWTRS